MLLTTLSSPLLRHIHLPSSTATQTFPTYALAAAIQTHLQRALFAHKNDPESATAPPPTLLTFTPTPTYTLGLRQRPDSPSTPDMSALRAPLRTSPSTSFLPVVHRSPRGGLTTYHGPGQLVLWPVVDLKPHHPATTITAPHQITTPPTTTKAFGVREYADLLQDATVAVLRALYGLAGFKICDPGVWLGNNPAERSTQRKVAAMGVHLRRHVSGLGVALNLDTPTTTTTPSSCASSSSAPSDAETNPWCRFDPCGLANRPVTCVREELPRDHPALPHLIASPDPGRLVAEAWAREFAARIGAGGVVGVDAGEVARLMDDVAEEAKAIAAEEEVRSGEP